MAKKKKQEAVKPEEPKGTLSKAKDAVVKAAGKVAEVVTHAAESVQEHVVQPVVEAVKPKKAKKPRFVRQKKEKRPQSKASALPPRSTKATAKLMTKGINRHKDEKARASRRCNSTGHAASIRRLLDFIEPRGGGRFHRNSRHHSPCLRVMSPIGDIRRRGTVARN